MSFDARPRFHWVYSILEFERFEARVSGHGDVVADIDDALSALGRAEHEEEQEYARNHDQT